MKKKNNFLKLQNMGIYCKNYKMHTEWTHSKKLVLVSARKIKAKSICTKYLTDRMCFDKINKEYDLEMLVKQFFLY